MNNKIVLLKSQKSEGTGMKMLHISEVSKIYHEQSQSVRALDNISIEIEAGTNIAIKGKSGSGKSTLLNVLAGIVKPTEGFVKYDEVNIYEYSEKELCDFRLRNIGIVFQSFQLLDELTVYENICFPFYLKREKEKKEEIIEMLRLLGLEDKKDVYPEQLSGGQQQRVAIARAFIGHPKLVLADEPTGNLDEATSNQIIDVFLKCQKKYGQTLVIITHDDDIAQKMERIITLKDGRIVADTRR